MGTRSTVGAALALASYMVLFWASAPAQAQTATWTGGAGDWDVGIAWDGTPDAIFPGLNDNHFHVLIDGDADIDSVVTVGGTIQSNRDVLTLTVDAEDTVIFPNSRSVTVLSGNVVNHGLLETQSGGGINFSGVRISTDMAQLTGTGVYHLSGTFGGSGDSLRADGGTIVHTVDHTIRGGGSILNDSGGMIHHGTIIADHATRELFIRPADDRTFVNNGVVQATGAAGLVIFDGQFINNTEIQVLDGSLLELRRGAEIIGGDLTTTGSGVIRSSDASQVNATGVPIVNAVTLTTGSNIEIPNGHALNVVNGLSNDGTITLPAATRVQFVGNQAVTGAGQIVLAATGAAVEVDADGTVLTNAAGHTIRGFGRVLNDTGGMINNGTIIADHASSQLFIRPADADSFTNNGLVQAVGAAGVDLFDGLFINNNIMEALDGSVIEVNRDTKVMGGTLKSVGSGHILPRSFNQTGTFPEFEGVTLAAGSTMVLENSHFARLTAGMTNHGTIRIDGSTSLHLNGDQVIGGTGEIHMNHNFAQIEPTDTFTSGVNHTIRGQGRLLHNAGDMVNNGTIHADVAGGTLTVRPALNFDNHGTMWAQAAVPGGNPATMDLFGGNFDNQGKLIVGPDGVVRLSDGAVLKNNGEIGGTGVINVSNGTFIDEGGVVSPGTSPGILNWVGDYHQTGGGTLMIEIAGATPGTGYDQLIVNGDAFLGGTVVVKLVNNYTPSATDEFRIVSVIGAGHEVIGNFADVIVLGGGTFGAEIDGADVYLRNFVPEPASIALLGMGVLMLGRRRRTPRGRADCPAAPAGRPCPPVAATR